jgi:hypothetical protein
VNLGDLLEEFGRLNVVMGTPIASIILQSLRIEAQGVGVLIESVVEIPCNSQYLTIQ